ncbi:ABC transporter permease subunit [Stigmatella aurantiaca]|uniref:ABC transporter, membrane spanning protein (Ribose) n=1 Tax=Stigmatella aurantiaca (strain DW4/3-1) TaxID=378806 RepID=Q08R28_STIAD|nr:ABC transporter permease [Stigmatella aurantiaca]ADO72197.1 inner-membrane translocator family protein [Stigmatella aurantiaca DW4/3-1]EAU62939.1 ABC transporter, membrane spanning protein (ribose) [Stigmatella aurantiaca DW4/3-1]
MSFLRKHITVLAGLLAYVLLYALAAARYDGFLSLPVFINFLSNNAVLGIVAVGMTFVILSGGIDLSVGAVMSFSSVLIGVLIMDHQWNVFAAMGASLVCGTTLGAVMGAIIHKTGIKPFIVTLAGMFFVRGLAFIIHLESIAIADPKHTAIAILRLGPLPVTALLFLTVVAIAWYVAVFTSFGRNVYALGGGEEASLLMGLPVQRTRIAVYAVSGFCASFAGAALTFYLSSGSHLEGVGMELDAIATVVIGGTLLAGGVGSVFGTLVGVLMLGLILTSITTYEGMMSSGLTRVAIGALLLAFVMLQKLLTRRIAGAGRAT